ncbi:toxin-antitoxin system TumE family protein [Cohnella silvisoli]|uniref:DUF6516 family protein n=1 Tax=Cohnella silvisoli TaxID=2873699 RepID=A0ABV1KN95_9BACL|nr:DUF6516 family protein [Cohnella silvisoli]MCD9020257.1 DUF6516 family protein [Cohnella silvisoli]
MNRRPPSNIVLLEKEFSSVIVDVRDGDSTGKMSSMVFQRYTFSLVDGSKLYVTERISNNEILYYQYDWMKDATTVILKFHSESHSEDDRYQTSTEPYHIHPPDDTKLHNMTRYPNTSHQELHAVFEFIFLYLLAQGVLR